MRIISVCSDDRRSQTFESEGMTSAMTTSDRERLMSRSPNLNTFDNLTDKKYEKHLTVVVNPGRFHRNMTSKSTRNIERSDRPVTVSASGNSVGSTNGFTIRSWQSCEDNKSTPDLSSKGPAAAAAAAAPVPVPVPAPGTKRRKKTLRDKLVKGFCFVGWLLCCPCCIVGFVLREPPETDADLATDPCWPFSS